MTRNRKMPFLEIMEVSKDDIGYYLKLKAQFEDGGMLIRWGIDQFTFRNIRLISETQYFDKMPGLKYEYLLLIGYQMQDSRQDNPKYIGSIEVIYKGKRRNIDFECSQLFASNLEWFRTIKSINDVKNLEWNEIN